MFVLALASFFIEFFLMFVRQHFLNMMTYLAILSIFFLNYFDAIYIRLTTYLLVGSISFDLMWVIAQADVHVDRLSIIGMWGVRAIIIARAWASCGLCI